MAKQKFTEISLNKSSLKSVEIINSILTEYVAEGYTLTLRQLYYQLVRRNLIENKDREYKKLSRLATAGRMGGMIDWDAIEDRLRKPQIPYSADNVADALSDILHQYRIDRMEGQPNYIEIWIEKDALSEIVSRITRKYHIRLMVNRGYSSCSAMYEAAIRFLRHDQKKHTIIYMGDHDPSGLDMVRDIEKRLNEFNVYPEIVHAALSMPQIQRYELPPNPAKLTDTRAKEYVAQYGTESWELDALEPRVLIEILEAALLPFIEMDVYNEQIKRENIDREEIKQLIEERQ